MKNTAKNIFLEAVKTVLPDNLIYDNIKFNDNIIKINNSEFNLDNFENIYVLGGGKASGLMAYALESVLGNKIKNGIISVKDLHQKKCKNIEIIKGSHPIPDENSVNAARRTEEIAGKAGENDLVIALISGGASALLSSPQSPLSLKEKQEVTNLLLKSGATIHEINTIRKHFSGIKGGQLAKIIVPATLITLVISDVVGDDLSFISSGPTVPDKTTFEDCINIIKKYNLENKLPKIALNHLKKGLAGNINETPKPGDQTFKNVHNFLIGNNKLAADSAFKNAKKLGYNPIILTTLMQGEAKECAKFLTSIAKEIQKNNQPVKKPACIISAGETTVTIKGNGKGGRNQEMALAAAIELHNKDGITFLSGGTDGIDGFSDAAGAVADGNTLQRAENLDMSALDYLNNNDSYNFFKPLDDLIITGSTFTNVMDLQIILVDK